jgi:hypothetical protein
MRQRPPFVIGMKLNQEGSAIVGLKRRTDGAAAAEAPSAWHSAGSKRKTRRPNYARPPNLITTKMLTMSALLSGIRAGGSTL